MIDFDTIVVGGGPAGTSSAMRCVQLGLKVLLIEKGKKGRHKPCGGILTPACVDIIWEALNVEMPQNVMATPNTIGLYYVPPSGRKNSGSLSNYKLFNINRDLFDSWLLTLAEQSGAEVWDETQLLGVDETDSIRVSVNRKGQIFSITTQYLIGADGVYSAIRMHLNGRIKQKTASVLQEYCKAKGDFGDYFYVFFKGEISPLYSYVIPKDDLYIIGVGIPTTDFAAINSRVAKFMDWLREEFKLKLIHRCKKEVWAIPIGSTFRGEGNVILTGDAAGFCNTFSGEGIRLAIASGVAAGKAIQNALSTQQPLALAYARHVKWIDQLTHATCDFATGLTDRDREEYVKSEINRIPLQ